MPAPLRCWPLCGPVLSGPRWTPGPRACTHVPPAFNIFFLMLNKFQLNYNLHSINDVSISYTVFVAVYLLFIYIYDIYCIYHAISSPQTPIFTREIPGSSGFVSLFFLKYIRTHRLGACYNLTLKIKPSTILVPIDSQGLRKCSTADAFGRAIVTFYDLQKRLGVSTSPAPCRPSPPCRPAPIGPGGTFHINPLK